MAELLQTERTYVNDLDICIKVSDISPLSPISLIWYRDLFLSFSPLSVT